jgi:hypothetical protein
LVSFGYTAITAGHTNSIWEIHSIVELLTLTFIICANDFVINAIMSYYLHFLPFCNCYLVILRHLFIVDIIHEDILELNINEKLENIFETSNQILINQLYQAINRITLV